AVYCCLFFFQAEDGIRDRNVTGVQTCALPILAVWILLAMGLGLALGRFVPGLNTALDSMSVGGISLPIAIGLLVMMYPVLAKVRYNETQRITGDRKLIILSLV